MIVNQMFFKNSYRGMESSVELSERVPAPSGSWQVSENPSSDSSAILGIRLLLPPYFAHSASNSFEGDGEALV